MFRGYSVGESCRVSVMRKGVTDPQSLSGRLEILAERYFFFFFLVVFFAFFAFFAFLAMLPSVVPKKVASCKSTSTCMHSEYTMIAKLISHTSKKVNERHAVATSDRRTSCVTHAHDAPRSVRRCKT